MLRVYRTLSCLLLLMVALGFINHTSAQEKIAPAPRPQSEGPEDLFKESPPYSAFPDLKPPRQPWEQPGVGFDANIKKYEESQNDLIFKDILLDLPKNHTPLQKIQYEQVHSGLIYIRKLETLVAIGKWNPQDFRDYLTLASDVYQVAAELQPTLNGKIRCYQARVILLKEIEQFTITRVQVGTDPSQNTEHAQFKRFQAEADLLKLQESVKDCKEIPTVVYKQPLLRLGRLSVLGRR
jgi:hypothetical protein